MRTAAHRGISLSLVMGFLAPLCIVIAPETPAVPNAAACGSGTTSSLLRHPPAPKPVRPSTS